MGRGFNYSAINNYGVSFAKGEYLLFLNNDTEMITPTAINELLGCCMREDVGVVGAKLLYSDDTVQHAGVVVGFGGYAGHVNIGIEEMIMDIWSEHRLTVIIALLQQPV